MAANPIPAPQDASLVLAASIPLPARPQSPGEAMNRVLGLVLNSVSSPETKRYYGRAVVEFFGWSAAGRLDFSRSTVQAWRAKLEDDGLSASTINVKLSAVRKLAKEAAANGLLDAETAAAIDQVPGISKRGNLTGNWLSELQTQDLIEAPEPTTLKGKRDRCALALLVGCGLRRSEAASLTVEHIQQRDNRWAIVDIRGKGGRIRTIAMPKWVKTAVDRWTEAAGFSSGRILRGMNRHGKITHDSLSGTAILDLATNYGAAIGVALKAHDLRRTCAKLCRKAGGQLEQIQLMLGHASIQTTERYLGSQQDLEHAPNDLLGLKWRDG